MSNGQINPAMNAVPGGILGNANMSSQQMQAALQQMQYNNAVMSANPPLMVREGYYTKAPRLYVEVDVVTNGFVFKCGDDLLIAKDLEELQQHFVAQVANLLLEKEK